MRLLFFEDGLGFGGSLISLSELLDGLSSCPEVSVEILACSPRPVSESALAEYPHKKFWRLITYKTRFRVTHFLSRLKLPALLRKAAFKLFVLFHTLSELSDAIRIAWTIKQSRIDIVHSNNGWVNAVVRAAAWTRRPCVVHFRGFQPNPFSARQLRILERHSIHVIAISNAIKLDLQRAGADSAPISVIHNPINIGKYQPDDAVRTRLRADLGFRADDIVVSMFGRLMPWKGQLEFLESTLMVIEELPRLRVMIVGDDSDATDSSYVAAITALTKSAPLHRRVVFTGYQRDPRPYYQAADIVVHNSTRPEPFGRVVTEAMAFGKAVIAMDEGGPREIISNGDDGILVEPRNNAALSTAILHLANEQRRRDMVGHNARNTVERRFSHLEVAKQVVSIYRELHKHI